MVHLVGILSGRAAAPSHTRGAGDASGRVQTQPMRHEPPIPLSLSVAGAPQPQPCLPVAGEAERRRAETYRRDHAKLAELGLGGVREEEDGDQQEHCECILIRVYAASTL